MNLNDLISADPELWREYTEHPFVRALAAGSLPKNAFSDYLIQDYLYLKHYVRAYALAVTKCETVEDMRFFLNFATLINEEIDHHVDYCLRCGVERDALDRAEEKTGTVAYTRYLLDIAHTHGLPEILAALTPCAYGYCDLAQKIGTIIPRTARDPDYIAWIDMYQSPDFVAGAAAMRDFTDRHLHDIDRDCERGQKLQAVFKTATRAEVAFWQQSLDVAGDFRAA